MGFNVDNDQFEQHSVYFRDALVRSCYMNASAGVEKQPSYLRKFFENLLLATNHELRVSELYLQQLSN
jgi:hypothetical protein